MVSHGFALCIYRKDLLNPHKQSFDTCTVHVINF